MQVKVKNIEQVYDGFFKVVEVEIEHSRFDGSLQTIKRLCFERGDAVARERIVSDCDEIMQKEKDKMLYKLLPIDSKEPVQYAGVYVTKWGRTDQPEVLFREATPEEIAEAFDHEKNSIALGSQVQVKQSLQLRSVLIHGLNLESVESMLKENDFYDKILNRSGRGLKHLYTVIEGGNTKVIYDWLTSLMWQKSGSDNYMTFAVAQEYITQLNRENFAGFNNWRLPTLDEAMSLMEREKKNGDLYIDPVFNDAQSWIWTADKESVSMAWSVGFRTGCCGAGSVINYSYVRAVRS